MSNMTNVGLRLHGGLDPNRCVELAKAAEANNFASVWFAENPFERGVLPMAMNLRKGSTFNSFS